MCASKCSSYQRSLSHCRPFFCAQTCCFCPGAQLSNKYLRIPPKLLVAGLWEHPLILRNLGHSFKSIVDFGCEVGFLHLVIELLLNIDSFDSSALVLVLHQQEGVIVRLLCVEFHVLGLVDHEIFE